MIVLAFIVVLLFGGAKLPKLARSMREAVDEFKNPTKADDDEPVKTEETEEVPKSE
jgi:sec-independent protein translocase protein TatA